MNDPAETTQFQERSPIFSEDVPCPHCSYNLRGLVEPRCPECGRVFDQGVLLAELQLKNRSPSLAWLFYRMCLHPFRP